MTQRRRSIDSLRAAVERRPENLRLRLMLVRSLAERGREGCGEAVEHLQKVLERVPDMADVHLLHANLLFRMEDLGQAGMAAKRALELGAPYPQVFRLFAWIALGLEEPRAARDFYLKAVARQPAVRDAELEQLLEIETRAENALQAADAAQRALDELHRAGQELVEEEEFTLPGLWYPGKDEEDEPADDWWRGPSDDETEEARPAAEGDDDEECE